ncbi:E3 ubiquitin-protein ligase synoviolin isoform X2 [Macrosteles quadrilineatus]|uniref:E3 ubiquitin-protein ligase synoviolin isoform X2 n=1 Tax=Macrosteles quadrilineatus TaxID=74068 RepID=UPI0023E28B76|nr:E3 ubiquitin-protein ligase synoviolin isoform X2 [Macrosteles quadrilineatus]
MRNLGLSMLSLVLTASVIGNAYYQKKQFYPSVVYITKSNPSMAVIYVQSFVLVILTGKIMKKVFFGELRAAEFEHLMEKSWYAMTETCLAFTVFRDDFSPKFVALFTVLLFLKSFHWLAEDRVDFMERSPVISWLFHLRVLSLLTLLGSLDLHLLEHAYQSTVTKGASVQLVFGFEYAILLTIIANIAIKYVLHTIALNSENPWENKAVFLLYTELIMGFVKVVLYILFMAIMIRISMLPLFAFRPMYYTMRAFKKAFNDVILSRRAIRNMNTLYPDATPEELAAADNVCIICREEMVTASKKLPCNHIFHTACLRSWFQRQQTCPTCRLNILRTPGPAQPPRGAPARPQDPAARAPPFQPPFPFPWPNPQAAHQPQAGPDAQAPSSSTTDPSAAASPPPPHTNIPFFCPPFPFMPFAVPPPVPPADLSQLSPEQLRQMEESGRAGVEARLKCLRNIQLLLDASVVLMQQYTAAAATAAAVAPPPSTTTTNTNTTSQPREDSSSSTTASSSSSATETSASTNMDGASGASADVASPPSTSTSATAPDGPLAPELEEARRRRLAKFTQQEAD